MPLQHPDPSSQSAGPVTSHCSCSRCRFSLSICFTHYSHSLHINSAFLPGHHRVSTFTCPYRTNPSTGSAATAGSASRLPWLQPYLLPAPWSTVQGQILDLPETSWIWNRNLIVSGSTLMLCFPNEAICSMRIRIV